MAGHPPDGYINVSRIKAENRNQIINVIGVVVDFREGKQTNGTDYMCTFRICDRTCSLQETAVMVRLFKPLHDLPQDVKLGDIVVFRKLKIMVVRNEAVAASNWQSEWAISSITKTPEPVKAHKQTQHQQQMALHTYIRYPEARFELAEEEGAYCLALSSFWDERGGTAAAYGSSKDEFVAQIEPAQSKRRKFALVKDMQLRGFYDMLCYVLKVFPESDNRFVIYVTDYTQNDQLFEFGSNGQRGDDDIYELARGGGGVYKNVDDKKDRIPNGRYTLQITLWDAPAAFGRAKLNENMFVSLSNVNCKLNGDGRFEGVIHGDKSYIDRTFIDVIQPNDPKLKELLARRRQYEQKEGEKKKQIEKELRKAQEEEEQHKVAEEIKMREKVNPNIHTGFMSVPTTDIGEILNIPKNMNPPRLFVNNSYRICCRVVQFRPPYLEDFCQEENGEEDDMVVAQEPFNPEIPPPDSPIGDRAAMKELEKQWRWHFELDVEGRDRAPLTIQVCDLEAERLLNMAPENLRANPKKVAALREKLFLLWGDLEERISHDREKRLVVTSKVKKLGKRYQNALSEHKTKKKLDSELEQIENDLHDADNELKILDEDWIIGQDESNTLCDFIISEAGVYEAGVDGDGELTRAWFMMYTKIK